MDIEKLKKDLDKLDKPLIGGMYNLCYGDGYYAKSLVNKYGKSIIELYDILKEQKMSTDQMVNGLERLNQESNMNEASYKYNIGFQEMVNFYKEASPNETKQMENLIKKDDWNGFKRLIKKVLGVNLKG